MGKSPPRSRGSARPSTDPNQGHDWEKLYAALEKILSGLKVTDEPQSMTDILRSIRAARRADLQATMLYTRYSRYLADARKEVARQKKLFRVAYRALLADPEFCSRGPAKQRQLYAEAILVDEQGSLDTAIELAEKLYTYLQCVDRVLANIKHAREDLSKQIKVIDVQREIQES